MWTISSEFLPRIKLEIIEISHEKKNTYLSNFIYFLIHLSTLTYFTNDSNAAIS